MTIYRLTFCVTDFHWHNRRESRQAGEALVANMSAAIDEHGTFVSHAVTISTQACISIAVRFEARDGDAAVIVAKAALRTVRKPHDAITLMAKTGSGFQRVTAGGVFHERV